MAKMLAAPPVVSQGGNQLWCWAAALSSWSRAVYGETITPKQIVARFQKMKVAYREGGLDPVKGIPKMAWLFYMDADPPLSSKVPLRVGGGSLSEAYLEPILQCNGHALVFYTETAGHFSHTIVVYGIDSDRIYYLDPSPGVLTSKMIYKFPGTYFLTLFAKPYMIGSRWQSDLHYMTL